jgi:endonuclease/exonuclease/phosphatase family metal-dependent hydrolase
MLDHAAAAMFPGARLRWISFPRTACLSLSALKERISVLKLLTWNIQSARSTTDGVDLDGVLACIERFAPGADVLCLQEVASGFPARDGSPGGDQFAGIARRLPGWHCAHAYAVDTLAPDGGPRRLGSMVCSRHPILQVLRHSLPWPADGITSLPRIALECTLDTSLGPLRLLNVHLEYFSEAQRLAQVGALRTLQREACGHARRPRELEPPGGPDSPFALPPRPAPAVLLGDFNMVPGSRAHQALLANFDDLTPPWRDAWALTHPGWLHAPTVGVNDTKGEAFAFDYAFVSADLATRVRALRIADMRVGSGHQPMLLELG